jgi:hypothetical protein
MSGGRRRKHHEPAEPKAEDQSRARVEIAEALDVGELYADFPEGREQRVQYVMRLMTSLRFETGKTADAIAAATGLNVGTVLHITSEASRRVKAACDPTQAREMIASAMSEGIVQALEMRDPKALSALASLGKVLGDVTGATARQKLDVTSNGHTLGLPADHPLSLLGRAPTVEELEAYAEGRELPAEKPN